MVPRLDNPESYQEVFDALSKTSLAHGAIHRHEINGLTLASLRGRTPPLSKLLAKTVAAGEYRFAAAPAVDVLVEGKWRTLYRQNLLDRVVLTVAARYLTQLSEAVMSSSLHSYRKGRSSWTAIRTFVAFLDQHRRDLPVRERGLYVLRRDIQKYGDSIPTDANSALWPLIADVVARDADRRHRRLAERTIAAALRQSVVKSDGAIGPLPVGLTTGSPIVPPCANLYLSAIDELCSVIPGGCYVRFGDDILFSHPDVVTTVQVSLALDEQLGVLGLISKPEKRHDLFFNGAGRRSPDVSTFQGKHRIEYLGAAIDFSGHLGLKSHKFTDFERELRQRLTRVARALAHASREARLVALCEAVRLAISPGDPMAARAAEFLRQIANDRGQLHDLDFRLALMIAELVANRRGPRAFRQVPYRELRRCGLPSLVHLRDRCRAPGDPST